MATVTILQPLQTFSHDRAGQTTAEGTGGPTILAPPGILPLKHGEAFQSCAIGEGIRRPRVELTGLIAEVPTR